MSGLCDDSLRSDHRLIRWKSYLCWVIWKKKLSSPSAWHILTGPLALIKASNMFAWCCYHQIRPRARWCEDKGFTWVVSIRNQADNSWQTPLIRHDIMWGYPVKKRLTGEQWARWNDACDYNWLIKVRSGQDDGDLWQCASEVVQHFACWGNTSPFLQK